jgi:RES domain-containing protein
MIALVFSGGAVERMLCGWNASRVIAGCSVSSWSGTVWRTHGLDLAATMLAGRRIYYSPTSDGGSRRVSGRYHRAPDLFRGQQTWPALYTSLTDGGCLAEAVRHAGSTEALAVLSVSSLTVSLAAVLDLTDPSSYGLTLEAVTDDFDYAATQEIGRAALERDVEAILVPPASCIGTNLVVFTERLRPGSTVDVLETLQPRLYVPRPTVPPRG